jgi:hypothetical protein
MAGMQNISARREGPGVPWESRLADHQVSALEGVSGPKPRTKFLTRKGRGITRTRPLASWASEFFSG